MRFLLLAAIGVALFTAPGLANEPKPLRESRLAQGMGALSISIQSQTQHGGKLYVWFLREGGDPANKSDLLKFERGQGVPLIGTNMIDSTPKAFAVPAGRYRLLGHSVGCSKLPPEDTYCLYGPFGGSIMPTGRYGADAPMFEIVEGRMTDAGEYILEAPAGTPMSEETAFKFGQKNTMAFKLRVRPSSVGLASAFQAMPRGPAPVVEPFYASEIRCAARPKGAMMYLPFTC
jgi:hypothetical protein